MQLIKFLIIIITGLIFTTASSMVNAGIMDNLSIRLEQPKSPTGLNDFHITFVALDTQNRPVSVVCKKQFEGGAVTSFDSTKNLSAGGNTDACHITSDVFNNKGNYVISVEATAGGDTASDSVTVYYNDDTPGDPKNYSKNKIGACTYEIKFKSAEDSGKTSKIEVYRSDLTSFTADDGSRVAEEIMGSNTDRTITNNVPDCNKTYYYVVRAFSSAGKGSGIVGDEEVKIINPTTVTTTTTTQTAIPVTEGAGSILGTTNAEPTTTTTTEEGMVLGVEGNIPEDASSAAGTFSSTAPNIFRGIGIAVVIFLLISLLRRNRGK